MMIAGWAKISTSPGGREGIERGTPGENFQRKNGQSKKIRLAFFFWMRDGFFESLKNAGLSLLGGRHGHFRFVQ